jgi:hypothetical protein
MGWFLIYNSTIYNKKNTTLFGYQLFPEIPSKKLKTQCDLDTNYSLKIP